MIKLAPKSIKQRMSKDEVKALLAYYQEITTKTGEQLNWTYAQSAFPYEIRETDTSFYLKGTNDKYYGLILSIGEEESGGYIKITLPASATNGDKGKANELCKFLAKKLEAELHLFNGRVMYFYKR